MHRLIQLWQMRLRLRKEYSGRMSGVLEVLMIMTGCVTTGGVAKLRGQQTAVHTPTWHMADSLNLKQKKPSGSFLFAAWALGKARGREIWPCWRLK